MIRILSFRSIRFEYAEEVSIDGAKGYRYKLGQKLVNGSEPENWCYNPQPAKDFVRFSDFCACFANVGSGREELSSLVKEKE